MRRMGCINSQVTYTEVPGVSQELLCCNPGSRVYHIVGAGLPLLPDSPLLHDQNGRFVGVPWGGQGMQPTESVGLEEDGRLCLHILLEPV